MIVISKIVKFTFSRTLKPIQKISSTEVFVQNEEKNHESETRMKNLEKIINKITSKQPEEQKASFQEANKNQREHIAKTKKIFSNESVQKSIKKLQTLVGSEGELAHTNLSKILNHMHKPSNIIGFYAKYKFYLTEEITVKLVHKFSIVYQKELSQNHYQTKSDFENAKPMNKFVLKLTDHRVSDLILHLESNFETYSKGNQLSLLMSLHRISQREFKEFIRKKLTVFSSENQVEGLRMNEVVNLLRLLVFINYGLVEMIKMLNNLLLRKFLNLYELGYSSVVQEISDAESKLEVEFISRRHFCLIVWCFKELNYRGTLSSVLASEIVKNNLIADLSYPDLCHFCSGIPIIQKSFHEKIFEFVNSKIEQETFENLEKENEETLRNLLLSVLNESSCQNASEVLCKSLLFRRKQILPKTFTCVFVCYLKRQFKLFKGETQTLNQLFINLLDKFNAMDCTKILHAFWKTKEFSAECQGNLNLDQNKFIKRILERLSLLKKSLTSLDILQLEEIMKSGDARFKNLKEIVGEDKRSK